MNNPFVIMGVLETALPVLIKARLDPQDVFIKSIEIKLDTPPSNNPSMMLTNVDVIMRLKYIKDPIGYRHHLPLTQMVQDAKLQMDRVMHVIEQAFCEYIKERT